MFGFLTVHVVDHHCLFAEDSKLAFLDAKAFERLLGPCRQILERNVDKYRDKLEAIFPEHGKERKEPTTPEEIVSS